MFRKVKRKIKKAYTKWKAKKTRTLYRKYWYSEPICNSFFLESGRGETVDGNIFAVLKALETEPEFESFDVFFVVTDVNIDSFRNKCENYGFHKVQTVKKATREYYRLLASCKYIITDSTFPPLFCKRNGQILVNTWHGTPLKKMGRAYLDGARGFGNVQRNFFMADYAVFPNEFTKNTFMKDFMLTSQFSGMAFMSGYPRNDAFYNEEMRTHIRMEYNLSNLQVLAYMPTWRGLDRVSIDADKENAVVIEKLSEFDTYLNDDQILFVKLHPFYKLSIDYTKYKRILPFPEKYETYDFLNATDVLITDYSSVFFDYAETGRPILILPYDADEYNSQRGLYITLNQLPFPIIGGAQDVNGVISNWEKCDTEEFINNYCPFSHINGGNYTTTLLKSITKTGDNTCKREGNNSRLVCVILAKDMGRTIRERVLEAVEDYVKQNYNVMVAFCGGLSKENKETMAILNEYENVEYYLIDLEVDIDDTDWEIMREIPGWRYDKLVIRDRPREAVVRVFEKGLGL